MGADRGEETGAWSPANGWERGGAYDTFEGRNSAPEPGPAVAAAYCGESGCVGAAPKPR